MFAVCSLLHENRDVRRLLVDPVVQVDVASFEADVAFLQPIALFEVLLPLLFGRLQLRNQRTAHRLGTALVIEGEIQLGSYLIVLCLYGLFFLLHP